MPDPSVSQSGATERAWIVYPDGRKLGPFESVVLAMQVRIYVERAEQCEHLAIKKESEIDA